MKITHSGMITLCGRPNVGKSTLLNAFVGEKIAIVSSKPQTTRNRISGIVTRGERQYVFLDTPGLHKARNRLGEYMVGVVRASVADVDAVLLVVDPVANVGEPELELIRRIEALKLPAVLVINKVDTLESKEKVLEVIAAYTAVHSFEAVMPISARNKDGVEELLELLGRLLPEGPQLFPEEMTTDQPERQVMAEILREKLLYCLDKEIPHAEKGVLPGPQGHGAVHGHESLPPDLGQGQGKLAGQPGRGPQHGLSGGFVRPGGPW